MNLEEARISKETVKTISQGIPGMTDLKDEVALALASDAEYRVREIIQDATKFMRQSKRSLLTTEDVSAALRLRNVEPLYGLSTKEPLKFVKVSGNTNLFYVADKEVDLSEFIQKDLPPVPNLPSLMAHWLSVEGVQPAISQNPPPETNEMESGGKRKRDVSSQQPEFKPLVKHVLSRELQLYYEHVTKHIVGNDNAQVDLCLKSVAEAPGLQQLLPYFVHFVVTKGNANLKNLKVLKALMRLVHALLANPYFGIEHYCHQLLPVVLTCVVRKKLGKNQSEEDHWSLRDFSAKIVADISSRFSDTYPTLQPRITKTYLGALLDVQKPLTTHYGAIVGLTALGPNVVNFLLVPHIKAYTSQLEEELQQEPLTPIRKYELAKTYSAIMLAAGTHMNAGDAKKDGDSDEVMLSSKPDHGFLKALPTERLAAMKELMPFFETRYDSMTEEFGDSLEPFRNLKDFEMNSVPEAMTL
eukprot:CAMPEP_0113962780 /NCGR_PEP_ID=MMETSP0011_2-20120614/6129_1 /TAXON_ID=101924 /ORGANISM="Rhodosorus marinus" /LENGTH=470 /DNA_ID=CAMNT_0000974719 /DNA_START=49 /DNA_END=1461 /DNA_ORIENTATION=- /assembly_acc=CAM_ASM_000156